MTDFLSGSDLPDPPSLWDMAKTAGGMIVTVGTAALTWLNARFAKIERQREKGDAQLLARVTLLETETRQRYELLQSQIVTGQREIRDEQATAEDLADLKKDVQRQIDKLEATMRADAQERERRIVHTIRDFIAGQRRPAE